MDKMFVHFNGTKAQFIEKGYPSVYTNSIVFIKGGTDIKSSCIYTHGTYFANFAEFLAAINYVKGISVNGQNYNAATGGGYVAFSASDPTIVDVDINEKGVIIGLSEDFINTIGNSNESADAQGSLFARIKNLAEIVGQLTGVDGDELVSIEGQISSAVNSLKKEILGTLDSTDSKTLEAINDELNTLGSKYNKLSINGKAFKDAANSAIVLTGEDINLGGDFDYSEGSIAGAFNDLNTKCTDVYDEVEELLNSISNLKAVINTHNKEVRFFCIEPVVVKIGDVEHHCEANQVATIFVGDEDFEIIPTSNESIQTLLAYPKPLTWYDWLEGVNSFSGIIFDMNELDTYKHWIQYYQDEYHVQKAQYFNCIFWSDKPYTHSPFEERTNYTLYYSAELPLCYSRIPENTYKPFYLAYGVKTDPNWNNPDYINSYSNVSGATQTFSYYGMSAIGIFDMAVHPIKLPKDCRGLMYHASAIQHAGVFDAINTTNFGAKKGSWQEAFGDCISLTSLYIQNLKASINISWSPINAKSIEFIVNNAANTSAITISVSPYTWYRLSDEIKTAASAKNITIALLTGNYQDDSRWNTKQDKVEGKGLSTEDFTTTLKEKLEGLNNYDDTQINQAVESLQTQINTLVSGDASNAIESFNEIIAFLNGIEDSQSLDSIVASIEQQIASKQSTITDLDSIRSGASKGATALQEETYKGTVGTADTSETLDEVETVPFVKYVLQSLTEEQKEQARTNIGAASILDLEGIDFSKLQTSKSISILFVGNSLTQDGIAYLPYMLKNYYPEVDFKLYIWYIGGYTLAQHYSTFTSGGYANIFSVAENNASWTNYNKNKTMSWVLQNYTFDIVCMQEYFNYKTSYEDCTDWNNCRDYIRANYKGGNALEFISLFHAPLRKDDYDVHEVYKRIEDGNALILKTTISEDIIPNGIAVYRALDTDLNNLGDLGQLSPDGTHTQEGLPCLLQTYVTLCWLFDRLGINKSVYGHPMRMTTDIYNQISVPGANLGSGVIKGTDAQNILAQEIAIKAYKEGKQFLMRNLYPFEWSGGGSLIQCTFSITTNVSDATIKINGVEQSSIVVLAGSTVNWEITKDGYRDKSGSEVVLVDTTRTVVLLPIVSVTGLTVDFDQGDYTIFNEQDLDDLRQFMTVTVEYADGTSEVTEDYTLEGTLQADTSTIMVSYGEEVVTIEVNVTDVVIPEGYTRYGWLSCSRTTKTSKAPSNYIYLTADEDWNRLSMECYIGKRPNVTLADGAGLLGARLASSPNELPWYGIYVPTTGVRIDARNTTKTIPYPSDRGKIKVVLDNRQTSPMYISVNDGEVVEKAWTTSDVINVPMSLLNNIPNGATTNMNFNIYFRIGEMKFRDYEGRCVYYYIPVVDSTNKIGMFDVINQRFCTAATAAAVTIGNSSCVHEVGNW